MVFSNVGKKPESKKKPDHSLLTKTNSDK